MFSQSNAADFRWVQTKKNQTKKTMMCLLLGDILASVKITEQQQESAAGQKLKGNKNCCELSAWLKNMRDKRQSYHRGGKHLK